MSRYNPSKDRDLNIEGDQRIETSTLGEIVSLEKSNQNAQPVQPVSTPSGPFTAQYLAQPTGTPVQLANQPGNMGLTPLSGQATNLPHAFNTETLQDLSSGAWNINTGASSYLNNLITSLSEIINKCMHPFISFVRDNNCTIEFDAFSFSIKDFMTRRVILRCDSTEDLYSVTYTSPIPYVFLVSQHTWHHRLRHPGSDVLRSLVCNNFISCNKEKPLVLCHACQLGKHVMLPFVSSNTVVTSFFDIIHSDMWTSPIPSLSWFKYYVLFLDHYSHFIWAYPLINKYDVLSKFILFRNYVYTQFKCEILSFQCDHGSEFDNRNLHTLFAEKDIQFRFSCPRIS
uniref:Ribonuclease H-like domain-containing protein n=1 Tax=Tanacetum cinerariifolium TaxID=118510 RepID=A0A699H458_TANCI|nr:ribonuclease H-like domain-containing protein [Tanacetum cinerariifolium]